MRGTGLKIAWHIFQQELAMSSEVGQVQQHSTLILFSLEEIKLLHCAHTSKSNTCLYLYPKSLIQMDCHTCRDNVNIITLLNNQLCFVFVSGGTGHCMSSFRPDQIDI